MTDISVNTDKLLILFLITMVIILGVIATGVVVYTIAKNAPQEHGPIVTIIRQGDYILFTWLGGRDITFIDSVEFFINNISFGKMNYPYYTDFGKTFCYYEPFPADARVIIHWGDGVDWNLIQKRI